MRDLQTRKIACVFEAHTKGVTCVAVAPHGECAVTGSHDVTVRFWDLKLMDGRAVSEAFGYTF